MDIFSDFLDVNKPFALFEKSGQVRCYQGEYKTLDTLQDIHDFSVEYERDIAFVLPYRIIKERGFEAIGDDPILAIAIEKSMMLHKDAFVSQLPSEEIEIEGDITPNVDDDAYAAIVKRFQDVEIQGGNASQVILGRRFVGKIKDMSMARLLSVYRRLLGSCGQYMTVLFANPVTGQYIIGATPERHLEVTGNETIMVPIAGTLRKEDKETFENRLEDFLNDEKEINELFQVVDEELKVMGVIAPEGGAVRGPFLREVGAVIHTEYELAGKRCINSIDALRQTFHAPTVVGSPMESAARIIANYETESRRYYAGEVGVYRQSRSAGPDGDLDTAILIRSAEIEADGTFHIKSGGGLVRDSDPYNEAKESTAKAMGMMGILTGDAVTSTVYLTDDLEKKYRELLYKRNESLSPFWIEKQNPYEIDRHRYSGKTIAVVNNEDDFAYMVAHILRVCGADVSVIDTFKFKSKPESLKGVDLVVLGPGPGNPSDMSHHRMKRLQEIITDLKAIDMPIFGVCLGHQALAVHEGVTVTRQEKSWQGTQRKITVFGEEHLMAFYNSFSAEKSDSHPHIEFDCEADGRVVAMSGPGFVGFQFHPESIMSQTGDVLIYAALDKLFALS